MNILNLFKKKTIIDKNVINVTFKNPLLSIHYYENGIETTHTMNVEYIERANSLLSQIKDIIEVTPICFII